MQDKEVVFGDTEENSPVSEKKEKKSDSSPKSATKERRDSTDDQGKKQHVTTKDGKFQFRRMKQPKKEKVDKKSASRFKGEGVNFKGKLIGVDNVPDPRGDRMCQDAMHRLKLNVKNLGPHKRKINIYVSLQGIKIKDEKTSELLYHHPVALISFISQDITDARAFGYVAGSTDGQHRFIAIKTEKPAFHVVVALRDLFQTVLNWKQEEMEQAKEKKLDDQDAASSVGSDSLHEKSSVNENVTDCISEEEKSTKEENIYFDVILAEPFTLREPEPDVVATEEVKESPKSVDDLLGLQDELNKLQQGIEQMDTSIAAATYTLGVNPVEKDPFDTSFVTPSGPKIDAFPQPMPAPVPVIPVPAPFPAPTTESMYTQDKYAVFSALDSEPSIFENAKAKDPSTEIGYDDSVGAVVPDLSDLEEEIRKKSTPPAKPPRNSKTTAPAADPSLFADLDPLGKDRPYKDKTEFFQDVKNPPKKVLNDLVSTSNNGYEDFANRPNAVGSPPFPMSSSPRNLSSPTSLSISSSSLPNTSLLGNLKFSVGFPSNNNISPFNPFENEIASSNASLSNGISTHHLDSLSSSPIPIPNRNTAMENKDRCLSNSSVDSPCSRSPAPLESPSSFVNQNGTSPIVNGFSHGSIHNSSPLTPNGNTKVLTSSQNGVSRPRPRPSANKSCKTNSSFSSSVHLPSPESEVVISRENMQSIANLLRVNGHRTRAASLPVVESRTDFRIQLTTDGDIFAKKNDPFGDDFFCSLPKRVTNHLAKTEIQDCV